MLDDDRTVLLVAAETLRERGRQVVSSAAGREAIADGLSHRPDLILLDILAGPTRGPQACRVVQKPGDARCVPINVITAATRPASGRWTAAAAAPGSSARNAWLRSGAGPVWTLLRRAYRDGGDNRSET